MRSRNSGSGSSSSRSLRLRGRAGYPARPPSSGPALSQRASWRFSTPDHYAFPARREDRRGALRDPDRAGRQRGPALSGWSRADLKIDGETMRVAVGLEVLGAGCHIRGYEAEVNGNRATSIVVALVRDRIRLNIRSPRGDEMTEFLHHDRTLILDTQIAHQHYFAWKLSVETDRQATVMTQERGKVLSADRGPGRGVGSLERHRYGTSPHRDHHREPQNSSRVARRRQDHESRGTGRWVHRRSLERTN